MQDADPTSTIIVIIYFAFLAFTIAAAFAMFALWIWMLIDCLKYESDEGNDKIVWILVLIFLHGIGALLYYFIRRRERLRNESTTTLPKPPDSTQGPH